MGGKNNNKKCSKGGAKPSSGSPTKTDSSSKPSDAAPVAPVEALKNKNNKKKK